MYIRMGRRFQRKLNLGTREGEAESPGDPLGETVLKGPHLPGKSILGFGKKLGQESFTVKGNFLDFDFQGGSKPFLEPA